MLMYKGKANIYCGALEDRDTNGISTKFWGKGYFNETLKLVLDYLFIDLKINRVMAKTPATNLPSINVL